MESSSAAVQVDVHHPDKVDSWYWAEADLKLLLQQFRGLKVTQQYKLTQKQLTALGPEGKAPLARVEMEMLGKVVNDFLAQLGPQLGSSSAAAEAAAGVSHPGNDTSSSYSGLAEDVSGMTGVSLGSTDAVLGTRGEHLGSQVGQQQDPRGAFRVGPGKPLTNSQVKKKNGLQKQREQLRAGEIWKHLVTLHNQCSFKFCTTIPLTPFVGPYASNALYIQLFLHINASMCCVSRQFFGLLWVLHTAHSKAIHSCILVEPAGSCLIRC